MEIEISRRKKAGWLTVIKLKNILTSNKVSPTVKAQIYDTHVLPTMTYGAETWNTTEREEYKLSTIQRKMKRKMTEIKMRDRTTNTELRTRSKVKDIIEIIYESKRRWAGHIARRYDNRWTKRVTEWRPFQYPRPRGRPPTRWCDPIVKLYGRTWMRKAQCRTEWRRCDLRNWRADY